MDQRSEAEASQGLVIGCVRYEYRDSRVSPIFILRDPFTISRHGAHDTRSAPLGLFSVFMAIPVLLVYRTHRCRREWIVHSDAALARLAANPVRV